MKDYVRQQKQVYLNRLKHIQEKLFDYQMQLEELEDDLDNEGRETKDDDYDDWCADLVQKWLMPLLTSPILAVTLRSS